MFDVLSERGLVVLTIGLKTRLLAFAGNILGTYLVRCMRHHKAKRDEVVKAIATELGVGFAEIREKRLLAKLKGMALFNSFESGARSDLNQWPRSEAEMKMRLQLKSTSVFDSIFSITEISFKTAHSTQHTVAAVELDALILPAFSLFPKARVF